jgi:hypothetical protein
VDTGWLFPREPSSPDNRRAAGHRSRVAVTFYPGMFSQAIWHVRYSKCAKSLNQHQAPVFACFWGTVSTGCANLPSMTEF